MKTQRGGDPKKISILIVQALKELKPKQVDVFHHTEFTLNGQKVKIGKN